MGNPVRAMQPQNVIIDLNQAVWSMLRRGATFFFPEHLAFMADYIKARPAQSPASRTRRYNLITTLLRAKWLPLALRQFAFTLPATRLNHLGRAGRKALSAGHGAGAAAIVVAAALATGIVLASCGGGSSPSASGGSSRSFKPNSFALPLTAAPGRPSLTGACQWQYPGNPGAVAEHVASSSPVASSTIECLDGITNLGGLHLTGYCNHLISGMVSDNPDRNGPASDQPPPWDQWECVPG
jgi:hypothetical protein